MKSSQYIAMDFDLTRLFFGVIVNVVTVAVGKTIAHLRETDLGIFMKQDKQLIERINQGDLEAFETLYHRYRDWVYRLAWRFTGRQDLAQDVVQETFIYLLKKFPGFHLTAQMTTFLYPVVRNLARDIRRKSGFTVSDEDVLKELPVLPQGSDNQKREDLATVLSILPEAQREVLLMRFVDGMSLAEITAALNIPSGTVKSRIHNALGALREDRRTQHYFFDT